MKAQKMIGAVFIVGFEGQHLLEKNKRRRKLEERNYVFLIHDLQLYYTCIFIV